MIFGNTDLNVEEEEYLLKIAQKQHAMKEENCDLSIRRKEVQMQEIQREQTVAQVADFKYNGVDNNTVVECTCGWNASAGEMLNPFESQSTSTTSFSSPTRTTSHSVPNLKDTFTYGASNNSFNSFSYNTASANNTFSYSSSNPNISVSYSQASSGYFG